MFKMKAAVLYLSLALGVALLAKARGRSGLAWFALAVIGTPVLIGVLVLLLDRGHQPPQALR
jgi:uncharacterized membrane protein YhdT